MENNFNVTLKQMITVIHRTINSVDKRLLNHGERVAYIMLNLLKADGSYSEEDMIKICAVSTFHDIGAYKVTERNKLLQVDTVDPFNHAIYGSLFIKYFSPLSKLYKIVLSHHFNFKYLKNKNINFKCKEGLLLSFADYVDRLYCDDRVIDRTYLENRCTNYNYEDIELLLEADRRFEFLSKLRDGSYVDEIYEFFNKKIITRDEVIAYSKMLAYSIDFRSESTVKHTIMVEGISYQIAKLYGLDEEDLIKIKFAAALHDIGKIATPIEILEKPGKLTTEEYEIIKSHAIIGYKILSGLGIDDIRDMATLHHEKLDGSGYPFGLDSEEISIPMRIVAIADIISALIGTRSYKKGFPKEKIINILKDMVKYNKIDSEITNLFIDNYDYIVQEAQNQCSDLMTIYLNINDEYNKLLKYFA